MFIKAYELGAVILAGLVLAFSLLFLQTGRVWGNEMERGAGVFCDTADQMKFYVAHYKDDAQAAINETNEEFKSPTACVAAQIIFIRGAAKDTEKGWQITEILVVAVHLPHGWQRIAPAIFFTAFQLHQEKEA